MSPQRLSVGVLRSGPPIGIGGGGGEWQAPLEFRVLGLGFRGLGLGARTVWELVRMVLLDPGSWFGQKAVVEEEKKDKET